ncbi:DUF445 domain-containing protein [Haloechinothrix alba]|uniref:DUF445 domain-containing protein n=1 Tax=Haloechinothrix alba TaxID=664784 RepID=UPI001FE7A17D|nr:DUF445 family protein [Haloechinothrix alba]
MSWLMPAFGFFVGYFTDWLALRMIFRPVEPRRFLGVFGWQGLFHKRRDEVAADYGNLLATEILTPRNIVEAMLTGSQSDKLFNMIDNAVQRAVDSEMCLAKPLVVATLGGKRYQELKRGAAHIHPATLSRGQPRGRGLHHGGPRHAGNGDQQDEADDDARVRGPAPPGVQTGRMEANTHRRHHR